MARHAQPRHGGPAHHAAHPHPAHSAHPVANAPPPPKTAVLEVTRSDDGVASYRLLLDNVQQKLSSSVASWDDASPWPAAIYGASYSPLHGRSAAFLIEFPPHRTAIKFHAGRVTAHSEGCIVTPLAHVQEIIEVLNAHHFPLNKVKFDVRGDFGIGFNLAAIPVAKPLAPGDGFGLTLTLTGAGAPNGVTKDIWSISLATPCSTVATTP